MQKVRLAIVGCGTISQLNAPGYLAHDRCEVAALCDPVPERAELRAREWGISPRIYTSYDDVLADDRIDAVELLTPTFLHPDQSIAALQAGKHVSCQKPAAGSVQDIRRMADAADRASTFYRTTENFLYYPPIVKARELIQEGAIGELGMVRIRTLRGDVRKSPIPFTEGAYVWRQDPDRNLGGMIYDDGWHKVATAIWWGGEVEKVSAIITRSDDNFLTELPASATWKYAGRDALATIEYAAAPDMPIRTSYYAADEFMEIIGSEGVLWVTRCTGEMLDLPPLVLHRGSETVSYQLPMNWLESFNGAAAAFIDGILEERQPMMDIHFSENVLRAIIAIYQSSDTTQWVHPSDLN